MNARRQFLKSSLLLAASGGLVARAVGSVAETCGLTPPQTPGPFYPGETQFRNDSDLTQIPGKEPAQGQIVFIQGVVSDEQCRPLDGVNVEIWQACVSGRYNNAKNPNTAPLDRGFKYWGETFTNTKGEYGFKTIIPGQYPAGDGWIRPPHIHFRIARVGYHELVTQMYFAGNPLNEKDLILRGVPAAERARVVVPFQPLGGSYRGTLQGRFDLTIRSVR